LTGEQQRAPPSLKVSSRIWIWSSAPMLSRIGERRPYHGTVRLEAANAEVDRVGA